ncbi:NYN domain-containing protein [Helicobacter pylori]|uniref:NYN domain-containing protein n=1 Tax=Helicobacter pylori TaxID=210 RepID=UPI002576EBB8|nr:NYN domain-containing protein [Helicobacter pylori]WJJ03531.1 NYN domain-containing protein [Helicobacter pylori]
MFLKKTWKKKNLFFDYNSNPQKVVDFCNLCVFDSYFDNYHEKDKDHEKDLLNLYRIFFYTAKPLDSHSKKKDILNFLSTLERLNHTALRLGKLVKRGNVEVQKQVDMLLGIDMLEISLKHFVEKVVLIGYDSDMSPALKLARTNGIQTEIILFEDLEQKIESSLTKHCDFIKKVKVGDIYNKLGIKNNNNNINQ